MNVTHIILMHDDEISCRRKKCKNKVLITPVDLDGNWRCSKCEKSQKIAEIDGLEVTMGKHKYSILTKSDRRRFRELARGEIV